MDYDALYAISPYGWTQAEKEQCYIGYMNELTMYHQTHCVPYQKALRAFGTALHIQDVPMLPISLFKTMELKSISIDAVCKTITSSGTTGQSVSHIYLDEATASRQQLALARIMADFLGPARLPMLIIDTPSVLRNRETFTARGAAIWGFSMFAKRKYYALHEDYTPNLEVIYEFCQKYDQQTVLIFGFTFMIWQYFCEALKGQDLTFPKAIVLHGGG